MFQGSGVFRPGGRDILVFFNHLSVYENIDPFIAHTIKKAVFVNENTRFSSGHRAPYSRSFLPSPETGRNATRNRRSVMINKIYEITAQCSIYFVVILAYSYCMYELGSPMV